MTTILNNDHVTLVYDEENDLLCDSYNVNIELEIVQSTLNAGVEKMKETNVTKWLTDTRAIGGFSEDGAQWVLEDWAPRAIEAGWKHWALIVPEAMDGRAAMVQFMNGFTQPGVTVRVFVDEEKARKWLMSVG